MSLAMPVPARIMERKSKHHMILEIKKLIVGSALCCHSGRLPRGQYQNCQAGIERRGGRPGYLGVADPPSLTHLVWCGGDSWDLFGAWLGALR